MRSCSHLFFYLAPATFFLVPAMLAWLTHLHLKFREALCRVSRCECSNKMPGLWCVIRGAFMAGPTDYADTDIHKFDPVSRTWSRLSPLPPAMHAGLAAHNDRLFLFGGGRNGNGQYPGHLLSLMPQASEN